MGVPGFRQRLWNSGCCFVRVVAVKLHHSAATDSYESSSVGTKNAERWNAIQSFRNWANAHGEEENVHVEHCRALDNRRPSSLPSRCFLFISKKRGVWLRFDDSLYFFYHFQRVGS